MPNISVKPFNFDELNPQPEHQQPDAPAPTHDEITQALEAEYAKGMADAKDQIASAQIDFLASVQNSLADHKNEFEAMIQRERSIIREIAREFLIEFCSGYSKSTIKDTASDMLEKLLLNSTDTSPAVLSISAEDYETHKETLSALLVDRDISHFVSLEVSKELCAGEVSLNWRGGSIARQMAPLHAAIDTIFSTNRSFSISTEHDS